MGRVLVNSEAVSYGAFVNAAYTLWASDTTTVTPAPSPKLLPPGWDFAAWIQMSDFVFDFKSPQCYGLIAQSQVNRNDYVLAIRGTEGAVEWFDDALAIPVAFSQVPTAGQVALGFNEIYNTLTVVAFPKQQGGETQTIVAPTSLPPGNGESFAQQVGALVRRRDQTLVEGVPAGSFSVAGHSLGAALATLFVLDGIAKQTVKVSTLCTFASPRVGNTAFARTFDALAVTSWRIWNIQDLVPQLPPSIPGLLDYQHVQIGYPFDSSAMVKPTLSCRHAMATCLHWLDPSLALDPSCPL